MSAVRSYLIVIMEEIDKLNENVCESVAAYIGTQFTSEFYYAYHHDI